MTEMQEEVLNKVPRSGLPMLPPGMEAYMHGIQQTAEFWRAMMRLYNPWLAPFLR